MTEHLTVADRMALHVLFWILKLINPTGYTHHVDALKREVFKESERTGGDHD